ncbi:hypothetical protein TW81_06450 [Vibrio galatheae]|uniref:Uncharacterized protein n=1 Tax=Vibrio galatheae TaxID=579748 RepID=A0A0F4NPF4_9VIBR|nr:hypothetical protein [Vibrio galatheae]KJY83961.1 hypothetical protein TW81_06450 [Vibrio galatheae]
MLTIIALLLIFALLTAVLAYYYRKVTLEKKANQQAKQALLKRSNQIKNSFKQNLERIAVSGALCPKSETAIFRLANFYFVFQPVNAQTVEQYAQLTKDFISTIDKKISANQESTEVIQQRLERFASALPKAAGGYTANFYRNDLPLLIFHLKQVELEPEAGIAAGEETESTQLAS